MDWVCVGLLQLSPRTPPQGRRLPWDLKRGCWQGNLPRRRSVLTPGGIRTCITFWFVSQGRYQDGFNGMQPVLGLIEDDGRLRFEYLVGDLQCFQAICRVDFLTQLRVGIV